MKKRAILLTTILALMSLVSCDEMFTVLPEEVFEPIFMELSKSSIIIMEGDSILLQAAFEPADIYNKSVYWKSDNPEVASIRNGVLTGVNMGKTLIHAISVTDELTDSCVVEVFPRWSVSAKNYRYDMPVYADVTISGERLNDRMVVGAYCGDELRGVGIMQEAYGVRYLSLRTYSNEPSGETISFRCYHRDTICFVDLKETVKFNTNKPVGTLSNLFQLTGTYPVE